jgi:hypothetical protein
LARGSDPALKIKAIESLNRIDREQRDREGPPKREEPGDNIRELLGIGQFGLHIVACAFADAIAKNGPRINLPGALPLFDQIAPNIAHEWPELWSRILERLDDECRAEAAGYAAGAPIDLRQFDWTQSPRVERPGRSRGENGVRASGIIEGEAADAAA